MASSTTALCLCTLTLALYIVGTCAFPSRLLSEYNNEMSTEDFVTDKEIQILSDIEDELQNIKTKLAEIEQLKASREPEVPDSRWEGEGYGAEVLESRPSLEELYAARDRRGSWGEAPERETDLLSTSPREQLLDMIKLYNYLQSQRDSEESSYRASKRQPPVGFHAVRGKRPSLPSFGRFPSMKRPSSFDFPVTRRDPPSRGFSAVRGKK